MASFCSGSRDVNCFGNTRAEILTGSDSSAVVNITRATSIENRLVKLLQALQAQAPMEGWGAYLTSAGAHQLTTDASPAPGASALSPLHSTPIVDGVTPLATDATPVFAPVWPALAFD